MLDIAKSEVPAAKYETLKGFVESVAGIVYKNDDSPDVRTELLEHLKENVPEIVPFLPDSTKVIRVESGGIKRIDVTRDGEIQESDNDSGDDGVVTLEDIDATVTQLSPSFGGYRSPLQEAPLKSSGKPARGS